MYLAAEVLPGRETAGQSAVEGALADLELVYAFLYSRVGNRGDAEDLTQEVALKAIPRLRENAPAPAVRGYLYATAHTVLADFWKRRLRLPESELPENLRAGDRGRELLPPSEAQVEVACILEGLPANHRRLLELRFLEGRSLREVAQAMGKSIGSVKVMQLRALRKAAAVAPVTGARITHV